MAITVKVYDAWHEAMLKGTANVLVNTMKASIHSGLTFVATNANYAAVSATEIAAGGGYTVGGLTMTGNSVTTAGAITTWNANDLDWGVSTTISGTQIVVRDSTNDTLALHIDLGGTQSSTAGTWKHILNALGLQRIGDTI